MKRLLFIFIITGLAVVLGAGLWLAQGQVDSQILLEVPLTIRAGSPLQINVTVTDAQAGDIVNAILFNGLHRYQTLLQLGTGGVAIWSLPADTLTQAGQSLVTAQYGDREAQQHIRVMPGEIHTIDLITTANALTAYGRGVVTLLALPRDRWGNPPLNQQSFNAVAQFPDTSQKTLEFNYNNGLAWAELRSHGAPGRVRIQVQKDEAASYLELQQIPGSADRISLSLFPECVLNDSRDIITLTAEVLDSNEFPVVDSTLVTFFWGDGYGYGRTIDGRTSLRIPSPQLKGMYTYYAQSGVSTSEHLRLESVEADCSAQQVTP